MTDKPSGLPDAWAGIIRHGLTAFGGGLLADGDVTEPAMQEAIGAVIVVVGFLWSVIAKRRG